MKYIAAVLPILGFAYAATTCPGVLPGTVVVPDLTVPVSKVHPNHAYGNSHNATIFTPNDFGTVINFNLPLAALGKTCSLYFSFPSKEQSPNQEYVYNGPGSFQFRDFLLPGNSKTTYNTLPPTLQDLGTIVLKPGNFYHLSTIPCPVGEISGVTFSNDTTFTYTQSDAFGVVNGVKDDGCPIGLFTTFQ